MSNTKNKINHKMLKLKIRLIYQICFKSKGFKLGHVQLGNRQKVLWKKVFGNKVLTFGTKKSPVKKVLEIKSLLKYSFTIFRLYFLTLFSRTFFWFQYDFIQKRSRKKSPIKVENAWKQRMLTNIQKKGAIDIKNTHGSIQNTDA